MSWGRRCPASAKSVEAERLETVLQELPALGVAKPRRVEALAEKGAQSGVQRADHGHRCRMVVHPSAFTPLLDVARQQIEIQVPTRWTLNHTLACRARRPSMGRGPAGRPGTSGWRCRRCRRSTRRPPPRFPPTRSPCPPRGARPPSRPQRFNLVAHAGRRLGVHHRDDRGARMGREERIGFDRPPPRRLHPGHLRPRHVPPPRTSAGRTRR